MKLLLTSSIIFLLASDASALSNQTAEEVINEGKRNGLTMVNEWANPDHQCYRDDDGVAYLAPPGGWVPNPDLYKKIPSETETPPYFYRAVRDCETKKVLDLQVIFMFNGYQNFIGGSRYQQQCIDDGTFDKFYDDILDKPEIREKLPTAKGRFKPINCPEVPGIKIDKPASSVGHRLLR